MNKDRKKRLVKEIVALEYKEPCPKPLSSSNLAVIKLPLKVPPY